MLVCRTFGLLNVEGLVHPLCLATFEATLKGRPLLSKEWSQEVNYVLTQIRMELRDQLFLCPEGEGLVLTQAGKILSRYYLELANSSHKRKDPGSLDDLSFRSFFQKFGSPHHTSSKMLALAWYLSEERPLQTPDDLDRATDQVRKLLNRGEVKPPLLPATPPEESGDNLTLRWFHAHWEGVYPELVKKIRSKCQTSDRIGQVEDHAMNFVKKAIQRDAFRSRIEANTPIPYSQVAVYAVRSALNDIRDTGSDAVCRELLGSRTEREIREGTGPDRSPLRSRGAFRSKAVRFQDGACVDLIDSTTPKSNGLDETILFNQVWGRIETLIRERFQPEEFNLISVFLKERIQGSSVREVAQTLKIDVSKAEKYSKQIKNRLGVPIRNLIVN